MENNKSPKIIVYSFNHKDSTHFTLYTIDEKEGEEYFKDRGDGLTKKTIYEGNIPFDMRILPKVDPKYLKHYMQFRSQRLQNKYRKDPIMCGVAKTIRGTCWDEIYDRQTYDEDGNIEMSTSDNRLPPDVTDFLESLLTDEDKKRCEENDKKEWEEIKK